jgi:phosphate-selective porin OprO and OprP
MIEPATALTVTLLLACPGFAQTTDTTLRPQPSGRTRSLASLDAAESAAIAQAPASPEPPGTFDRIWKFAEWYVNNDNPVVQRVAFTGRFQHDFAVLDADQGELDESNLRRLRLGPRVTMFRKLLLHAEVELNPQERDPTYVRFTDMYAQWTHNSQAVFTAGKQSVPFTLEGATSSKELITIDRSNLANNLWFPQEYMPGISVSGRRGAWNYRGGLYSAGEANRELGEFSGGLFTLGTVGYDFSKALGVKQALLTGNYVYQHPDANNTFTRQLEHVMSANGRFEVDRWGVFADFSVGDGYLGQSDLWAVTAMPFYNVTPKLQFVTRYTYLDSEGPNGVRLATYESRLVSGRGDEYSELYLGGNYYFYGHKLKLQTGVQWADMNDRADDGGEYSGVSWTTGLRVGW